MGTFSTHPKMESSLCQVGGHQASFRSPQAVRSLLPGSRQDLEMRDRRGHGRSGSEQEGGQTRVGEEGNGGHRCFRRTKDTGRVAMGQKKRDNEEQKQGLGRPPVPMPLPRPPAAADQCLDNQKPVWLTGGCPEHLLNYDENFPKCPV